MKLLRLSLVLTFILSLCGCGYFSDTPVEDSSTYKSEQLANSCQIDVDKLSKILQEDVQAQIDCLETNLINFTKYVKRSNSETVTDHELSSFVKRFFVGHAELIVDSLGLIFDINTLFLRDEKDVISTENIPALFQLLRVSNVKLVEMMNIIKNYQEDDHKYKEAVEALERELQAYSVEVKNVISNNSTGIETEVNLRQFYDKVKTQFSAVKIPEETFNGILALKKLFVGGKREILTRRELFSLLDDLPKLGRVAFGFIHAAKSKDMTNTEIYLSLRDNIATLNQESQVHRREEEIFLAGEIEGLMETFFKENSELFVRISKRLKVDILGARNANGGYTYSEVKNVINLSISILDGLVFYEKYKEVIDNKKLITKENWNEKKTSFIRDFEIFRTNFHHSLDENIFFPERIYALRFAQFLANEVEEFPFNIKVLDLANIAKIMMVGGSKSTITKLELLNILEKFKDGISDVYNLVFMNESSHNEQQKLIVYYEAVKKVKILISNQDYLPVSSVTEIVEQVSAFLDDENIKNYVGTVEILKEKILGGYASSITISDIKKVLDIAEDFSGRYLYNHLAFDAYADDVASPDFLGILDYKHHPAFAVFGNRDILLEYKKDFNFLLSKFRVFKDETGAQYYGDDYRRTRGGFLEIYSIHYAIEIAAEIFGSKVRGKDFHGFNMEQLNNLLYAFKPVLETYGMWSKYPENFSRNILLLADLFQANSDGNLIIDPIEGTEYGALALFAIKYADLVTEKIKEKCEIVERNEVKGFEVDCYRPLFFPTLMEDLNMKEYLPKLYTYIQEGGEREQLAFVRAVEGFARESRDMTKPQTRKDIILLFGAMLNIESTFLRYDRNKNNIIDPHELESAYPTYKGAIASFITLSNFELKLVSYKSIFKYMIKYMEIPNKRQIVTFHNNPFNNKDITSMRINIGSLLYNMVTYADQKAKAESN